MSGAEAALEAAILSLLAGDAGVRAALGDPLRVTQVGENKPAYPCLEVAHHVSEPRDAAESEVSEHRIDFHILSRAGGRDAAKAALVAARTALRDGTIAMAEWRCVLLAPAFTDLLWLPNSNLFRAHLRVRAMIEPA